MSELIVKFRELEKAILNAGKILVIAHRKPDGDAIGSCLALMLVLEQRFSKSVTVACVDKPVKRYSFLQGLNRFVKEFDYHEYDLIIVCDSGAHYMTDYHKVYPGIFSGEVPTLNLDHHASNDMFGTMNIVDSSSASTTFILYKFFKWLDVSLITPAVATCLLTGIYNDTGSFMHSNTTREVFEVCSDLSAKGAKSFVVAKSLFKNTPLSTLKLWGRVFENIKVNKDGVALSVVSENDFKECGAKQDDLSGVVDIINAVPGVKFSVILNEDGQGNVKGSFRTQNDDVDLAEIAKVFGGGGHRKAAGFSIPGKIEKEVRFRIVSDKELLDVNEKLLPEGGGKV